MLHAVSKWKREEIKGRIVQIVVYLLLLGAAIAWVVSGKGGRVGPDGTDFPKCLAAPCSQVASVR